MVYSGLFDKIFGFELLFVEVLWYAVTSSFKRNTYLYLSSRKEVKL